MATGMTDSSKLWREQLVRTGVKMRRRGKMKMMRRTIFEFKPFSKKQRQILNWWMPESPVHDYDGTIADGAIRSGKTVSMSLGFVFWAMEMFDGQNFIMAGKTHSSFQRNVLTKSENDA